MADSGTRLVRSTCPRDCYDSCGLVISVGTVTNGLPTRVLGDREHPVNRGRLCRKCTIAYNGVFLKKECAAHASVAPRGTQVRRAIPGVFVG